MLWGVGISEKGEEAKRRRRPAAALPLLATTSPLRIHTCSSSPAPCAPPWAQVILKPDPGNPQELYLGSLEALGIDTRAHDVRFVEDNWESPVLGAWGLGWEVRTWVVGGSVGGRVGR